MRGLIVGLQNMLEKPMFQDSVIRQAATDSGLGIVWISPGSIGKSDPPLSLKFGPLKDAGDQLQQVLVDLAKESGYQEIEFAPLLAVGHSAATPFVWGMAEWNPKRVFAILPYKGWYPGHVTDDVPIFHVSSEWAEVGGSNWGETWRKDSASVLKLRARSDRCLIGECAELGNGHYDWNGVSAGVIAMFIRKAVQYRLPAGAALNQTVDLKPIDVASGVLVDASSLGTANFKAVPYNKWQGDRAKAYWYFDEELARTVNDFMAAPLSKKPQVIDFIINGQPAPLEKAGTAEIHPQFLEDGVTWKVEAAFLDRSPTNLYGGAEVGHAPGPILYKVSTGAITQTGTDTFRVWLGRGGVVRQGPPWEPWGMAYHPGNNEYRSADRPIHFWVNVINKEGKPQTIDFPKIPDQRLGTKSMELHATADAGLPVQFFVVSGPAELQNDTLRFEPIPPRSRFPVKVIVGAFQWGRGNEPKVQSAGPVMQEFFIQKPR
ncbi:MAG TPA: hypothetical protein VMV72_10705 [Verrucomicrobiae bacterium]|nr:hypothetical protein [Verrucomicrobiae bacterium]